MTRDWNGLLLIDKPSGPTSHDVVACVRRATGQKRIGHAGTLDPLASGLLPLVLGVATRLVRFLPPSPKVYTGEFELGFTTDSDDVCGQVLARHAGPLPGPERVLPAGAGFVGRQLQAPPAVSARKVAGRRMYELSRRGIAVEAAPREVEIFDFELLPTARPARFAFRASVTGGTYIRSIVRDLGRNLGCGATLTALRRVSIGPMAVEQALTVAPDTGRPAAELALRLVPPGRMPLEPPALVLAAPEDCRRFLLGARVPAPATQGGAGPYRVLDPSGRLLGLAEQEGGTLRPRVVLAHAD